MGDTTQISWTDSTWNPWIGCSKVSTGCDFCYAEELSNRYGWAELGPHGERVRTEPSNWKKPLSWNRAAQKQGVRRRVFCASLADVFDNKAPEGARDDLWELIRQTPHLDWQLLTKRPENIRSYLPDDWGFGWDNVWLGVSAEDQETYDHRWPILVNIPAVCFFISYEPAIGPLSMHFRYGQGFGHPNWLIWGGESGSKARVMDPQWARDITAECQELGVACFGKQWGTYASNPIVFEDQAPQHVAEQQDPPAHGKGGALLDGHLWREFPEIQGA